jgi:8-oxo-dGTP pyrophosphatase MutT (NUDIX family)
MPHLHEKYDFIVTAYIVFEEKVLMIHHNELKMWLPIGGHIELDQDPEEALFAEIREECGLEVEVMSEKPTAEYLNGRFLYTPNFLDVHKINEAHAHIG